ncbi:MAG TPA: hypothetical protein VFJ95_14470 [Gammaproteobacteria bacterium]|nr:hypothetical protein [Gammaproteobacteria bacterium]
MIGVSGSVLMFRAELAGPRTPAISPRRLRQRRGGERLLRRARAHRLERAERAGRAGNEAEHVTVEHRDHVRAAELRRVHAISELVAAFQRGACVRQHVAIHVAVAHVEQHRAVVDDLGTVDARERHASLHVAVVGVCRPCHRRRTEGERNQCRASA